MTLRLPRLGLLMTLALVASIVLDASEPKSPGDQTDQSADRLLARGRLWAGGTGLENVKSLTIKGTQGPRGQTQRLYDVFILRPDDCQIRREGGWVHTLERSAFWMVIPQDFQGSFTPEMQATAERSTRQNCADIVATFLLRPWQNTSAASVGPIAVEGLRGEGVRIFLPSRPGNTFVFDPGDGRPLGYVSGNPTSVGEGKDVVIALFQDYSTVNGVRLPTHIEFHYLPEQHVVDWKVAELRVNDLKASDFHQGGGNDRLLEAPNPRP